MDDDEGDLYNLDPDLQERDVTVAEATELVKTVRVDKTRSAAGWCATGLHNALFSVRSPLVWGIIFLLKSITALIAVSSNVYCLSD